jgi:hypothetical protein
MTARDGTCPNCGAVVHFDWSHAVQASCPFCKSVIVRTDVDIRTVGTVGDFPATSSPIQLGTTGMFRGQRFSVVGRIVYAYDRGSWNDWHARLEDGRSGWLSDARGEYGFQVDSDAGGIPPLDALHIGGNLAWDGRIYKVMTLTSATYRAVEGELPFTTWDRREASLVGLDAADGHIATIDYRDKSPALSLGEWVGFSDLALGNLRVIDGWPLPA